MPVLDTIQTTDKPCWAALADLRMDCTDAYQEQTDPEGEFGETCEALFTIETDGFCAGLHCKDQDRWPVLVGLCISDRDGPSWIRRDVVKQMLGADWIERIEAFVNRGL